MLGNGPDRHQRELRELLEEHGRLVRAQGGREVWQFANGKTVVVPGPDARIRDSHSWKNALGAVRRALRDVRANPSRQPTVFQNLLRAAREMPGVLESLTGAHVVVADEVARLYTGDPERAWTIEDFPNVMPPFARYFVEWDVVADGGRRVTGGILFTSQPLDAPSKVSAVKTAEPGLAGQDLLGCTLVEADIFIDVSGHITHLGAVVYFADVDGKTKRLSDRGCFIAKPDERAQRELAPAMARAGESDAFAQIAARRPQSSPFISLMVSLLNVGVLATCFMHSRSTRLSPAETKQSEVRKRLLKPGQRPAPSVRYHVLEIEPLKKILRTEGRQAEDGLKKALHTVRGHFKLYADKGMFGRDDLRGLFWFESHDRGDPDRGTVVKDYSIGPIDPSGEGPTQNPPSEDEEREARERSWAEADAEKAAWDLLADVQRGTPVEIVEGGNVWRAEFHSLHELPGIVWVRYLEPQRLPSLRVEVVSATKVRVPDGAHPMTREEFDVANRRRHELINANHRGRLTEDEKLELADLERMTAEYIDRVHPLPPLPELPDVGTENPVRTCPGCGKGIKDAAARCWSCGLVFQGDEAMRPMFGRVARGAHGAATNPGLSPEVRELMRRVENDLSDTQAAAQLDRLLGRTGVDVAAKMRHKRRRS